MAVPYWAGKMHATFHTCKRPLCICWWHDTSQQHGCKDGAALLDQQWRARWSGESSGGSDRWTLPTPRPFTQVIELHLVHDRATHQPKGSAFLWYATKAEAQAALKQLSGVHVLPDPTGETRRKPMVVRHATKAKQVRGRFDVLDVSNGASHAVAWALLNILCTQTYHGLHVCMYNCIGMGKEFIRDNRACSKDLS